GEVTLSPKSKVQSRECGVRTVAVESASHAWSPGFSRHRASPLEIGSTNRTIQGEPATGRLKPGLHTFGPSVGSEMGDLEPVPRHPLCRGCPEFDKVGDKVKRPSGKVLVFGLAL